MTPDQINFISAATIAARDAGHVFPVMAACEAALESAYGCSKLAKEGHNLFGTKQHATTPVYNTLLLPTQEWDRGSGRMVDTVARWVMYPDSITCMRDRMATLRRLAPQYLHYRLALDSSGDEDYVKEVSQTWSTDPKRADKCISIFRNYSRQVQSQSTQTVSQY